MAIQYVNTGTSANKGDGDTLRVAFGKINNNFSQLSTLIGESSATITVNSFPPLDPSPGELWYDTVSGRAFIYYDNFWVDSNPPAINPVPWNTVTTNIISHPGSTFDIGSTSSFWQNIYADTFIAKNLTFLNTSTLTIQTDSTSSWKFSPTNQLISSQGTWTDGYLKFVGDPVATRLEIVPDESLYLSDRYIIIDPINGNDIHIRAGGILDSSNSNLKIGGEKLNIEVSNINDGSVYINTFKNGFFPVVDTAAQWIFNANGSIVVPELQGQNSGHLFTATGNIVLTANSNKWIFKSDGLLTLPNGSEVGDIFNEGQIGIRANNSTGSYVLISSNDGQQTVEVNDTNIRLLTDDSAQGGSSTKEWIFDRSGDLTVPNYINFAGNTFIGDEPGAGTPVFRIVAPLGYGATIETDSDISGTNRVWSFDTNGTLTFPDGTTQTTAFNFIDNIPVSSTSTGIKGQIAVSTASMYVCVGTNSWLRFDGVTF